MAKARRGRSSLRGRGSVGIEWVGGRFQMPYTREDPPQRPELGLWLELPSGLVVGHSVLAETERDDALASALEAALDRPTPGASGSPARLRVADAGLAGEVRGQFGDRFAIDVAPTPELDELYEDFLASAPRSEDGVSYLEGGRVSAEVVARMFQAASGLYRCAPWRVASDSEVLRADCPALGVEGACVSIIGALGESLGIIIFPSLLAYERFGTVAQQAPRGGGRPDLGGPILSLDFRRAREVPAGLRREAASRGWATASPDAFPLVTHRDRDGTPRPMTERDLRIATECAFAVASFFARHPEAFGGKLREPVSESITTGDDGATVRLTAPYDAYDEFEPIAGSPKLGGTSSPSQHGKVGRNDPCPCGSGKKYKKCCLREAEGARQQDRQRANVHELDERVVLQLHEFAFDRYGSGFVAAIDRFKKAAGGDDPMLVQLRGPCSVYEACIDGERPVDAFLADHAAILSPEERAWLAAQTRASLGVWEVTSCEPGVSVTVQDRFSGERRNVREVRASRNLLAGDAVLARVVDYEGASYFCGMFPRMLAPDAAAAAMASFRKSAGARAPKPGEPRDDKRALALVRAWARAVRERAEAAAAPKKLVNTDGEALLLTTDHFEFDRGSRAEVRDRLLRVEGVQHEADEDGGDRFTIFKKGNAVHAHWENTVLAHVVLEESRLRLETNSVERADRLRARLESGCSGLLRHRARAHGDPLSSARPSPELAGPAPVVPPEAIAAVREFKARHYAAWIDTAIPALHGKTPREAVRTKRGRELVDVLLRTMENAEQRSRDGAPFDFAPLRRSLGLDAADAPGAERSR